MKSDFELMPEALYLSSSIWASSSLKNTCRFAFYVKSFMRFPFRKCILCMNYFHDLLVFLLLHFLSFQCFLKYEKRGIGELPCKLKPVIFHEVKRAVSTPGLYKGVMLAIPSKSHFGALHYWVQQGFTRQLKTKKLLRLSGLKNHNSFCVIVDVFFQKYCIRRYRKEQEKL